jgi:hypothetical protein
MVVLARGDTELGRWPLGALNRADLGVVDQLARMHLVARRVGCSLRLDGVRPELSELLELVGLTELETGGRLRQVGGEAEDGEQVGVEEVVVPDDPVA